MAKPLRFTITITDPTKLIPIEEIVESGFFGLGHAYRLADPLVLYFRADADVTHAGLIETFEEFRLAGALTYIEDENKC